MSVRTPVREVAAAVEESSTPSSIRRSTRIAGRRSSVSEENDLDRLSVSSTGSQRSMATRSRAASKSPLLLRNEEENNLPAKRTRRKGSTSSLVEEDLESLQRGSPIPAKVGKRTTTRSMSCSPISEMENVLKSSTPHKDIPPKSKRRLSILSEPVTSLESIKEVDIKSAADTTSSIEPNDDDLPFKKKRAVLMQTITENPPEVISTPAKSNGDVHLEESDDTSSPEITATTPEDKSKELNVSTDADAKTTEKKLLVVLHDISHSVDSKSNTVDTTTSGSSEKRNYEDTTSVISLQSTHVREKENIEVIVEDKEPASTLESSKMMEISPHEYSFDEPMDVDVTVTPVKGAVSSDSHGEIESVEAVMQNEQLSSPEKNLSPTKSSTISDETALHNSEASVQELDSSKTTLPEELRNSQNETLISESKCDVTPSQKSVASPKPPSEDEEIIVTSPIKSSDINSPRKSLSEQNSQITEVKLSPVLVASTTSPLRRSARLINTPSPKPQEISKSSPPKKGEDIISGNNVSVTNAACDISQNLVKEKGNTDKKQEQVNITLNSSIDLDPVLKEKIATLAETLEVDSSSSDGESVTDYIDDMAEEAEEDTPSEGSNDIIDIGESVGSTGSQIDSDESYAADSFIDDDEDELELLSGEEYDLDQDKNKPTSKPKRIIPMEDSSDEEQETQVADCETGTIKVKDDSDIENMSTRPYCGLSPPTVISVRDSPDYDEKLQNNEFDGVMLETPLINKKDNLESLEQIKEHNKQPDECNSKEVQSPQKAAVKDLNSTQTTKSDSQPTAHTPNNSILDADTSLTENKRLSQSSINIKENVSLKEIVDGSVADRILKVVEAFCSTVNQSACVSMENISLNLSLDYVGSPQHGSNEDIDRRRVLSESGINFSPAKKRLSRDDLEESAQLSRNSLGTKRKSTDHFVVGKQTNPLSSSPNKLKINEEPADYIMKVTPSKKIKVNKSGDASIIKVTPPKKMKISKSRTEKSPKKLMSPLKITNEEPPLVDVVIPEPKRTPPKNKKSAKLLPQSVEKRQDVIESFAMAEVDENILLEKKIGSKKQKLKSFTDGRSIPSATTVESRPRGSKKKEKKTIGTFSNNKNTEFSLLVSGTKSKRDDNPQSNNVGDLHVSEGKNVKKSKQKKMTELKEEIEKPNMKKLKQQMEDVHPTNKDKGKKRRKIDNKQDVSHEVKQKSTPKSSTDSEMSDDLDEKIHAKYNNIKNKGTHVGSNKTSKRNILKSSEEPSLPSTSAWQIDYLPSNVKQALLNSYGSKSIAKDTNEVVIVKPKRKPKLRPSDNNPSDSWHLEALNVSAVPTTSRKLRTVPEFHAKDFKSQSTFDSKRVKRMDSKQLLKNKEKI